MNLNREILRLAVPSIFANITVPLVGMVDMAVVGHLQGAASATLIGGISIGTMLFDLLYWSFGFLRTGTGGLTAQAYGRRERTDGILRRALRIALISGLALIALQWAVLWLAFLLVECSPEVKELAIQYFHIRIWAAPATLSLFAFKGWFIGMQDSVRPMTADLLVNGINILLSLGLGFGWAGLPAMGFAGVALGTVIAQWICFFYCIYCSWRRCVSNGYEKFCAPAGTQKNPQVAEGEEVPLQMGRFLKLNGDLFLRSMGMIAVYIGFTVISARYGDMMLAVSSIIMKLLMFFSFFTDGFAFAGEALSGRFIGEQSKEGLRSTIKGVFAWSAALAIVFMAAYGFGGMPIFRLMASDPAVADAGREFLPWLLLMPLIGCPAFVWDGIFIGATASADLRNSTLLCAIGFFAVWFAGRALGADDTPQHAIHLLMLAYFMHLAVRSVYLSLRYPSARWITS